VSMPLDHTYNFALARGMLVSLTCREDHETPLVVASLTNDPTISTTIQINIHVGQRLAREGTVRVVGSEPAISRPLGKVCEIWRVFDIRLVLRGRHDRRSWPTHRGTRITELSDCRETSRGLFSSSRARATDSVPDFRVTRTETGVSTQSPSLSSSVRLARRF